MIRSYSFLYSCFLILKFRIKSSEKSEQVMKFYINYCSIVWFAIGHMTFNFY